jgi:hypothetical protein
MSSAVDHTVSRQRGLHCRGGSFTGGEGALEDLVAGAARRSPEVGGTAVRPLSASPRPAESGLVRPAAGQELGHLLQPRGGEVGGPDGRELVADAARRPPFSAAIATVYLVDPQLRAEAVLRPGSVDASRPGASCGSCTSSRDSRRPAGASARVGRSAVERRAEGRQRAGDRRPARECHTATVRRRRGRSVAPGGIAAVYHDLAADEPEISRCSPTSWPRSPAGGRAAPAVRGAGLRPAPGKHVPEVHDECPRGT